jgi:nicotinamide-nucleotide amidase
MVWIAVAGKHNMVAECYNFANNRERNIIRSAQTAINMLRQLVMTKETVSCQQKVLSRKTRNSDSRIL